MFEYIKTFSFTLICIGCFFSTKAMASPSEQWDELRFKEEITQSVVVVDFYADWCPPCQKFGPIFEKVAKETASVPFGKVNVSHAKKIANAYKVTSIPTVIIFKNGREFKRREGGCDEAALKEFVKSAL